MNSVRQAADYPQMIAAATSERVRVQLAASWIHAVFDQFYKDFLKLTWSAKAAFENRDYPGSVACAKKRLGLYNATVYALAWDLRAAFPALAQRESLWAQVEAPYLAAVQGRYEADLALAYIHSTRRRVHYGEWTPVEYGFGEQRSAAGSANAVHETFACSWPVDQRLLQRVLQVAELLVPFRDPAGDAVRIARRLNDVLAGKLGAGLRAIEMIRGGFFRNRGAYLVGRLVLQADEYKPFVIALLNEADGVAVAAVLHVVSHVHNLFNTTEAPCQVTNLHYHELSAFLHSIMPSRPLGLHYSTIGFHHVSKVAVMNELRRHLDTNHELLDTAPGFPGTVAIAFTSPRSDYILKVIRDRPTVATSGTASKVSMRYWKNTSACTRSIAPAACSTTSCTTI